MISQRLIWKTVFLIKKRPISVDFHVDFSWFNNGENPGSNNTTVSRVGNTTGCGNLHYRTMLVERLAKGLDFQKTTTVTNKVYDGMRGIALEKIGEYREDNALQLRVVKLWKVRCFCLYDKWYIENGACLRKISRGLLNSYQFINIWLAIFKTKHIYIRTYQRCSGREVLGCKGVKKS